MKTVAFVPIRLNSQRVAGKNLRPLDGSPLMCHILKTLTEVEGIDEVYVFCSDEGIRALLPKLGNRGAYLVQKMNDKLVEHRQYIRDNGIDLPEVRNWKWEG